MDLRLSPKQEAAFEATLQPGSRHNLGVGSIRAGKSYVYLQALMLELRRWKNVDWAMTAASHQRLIKNTLEIEELVKQAGWAWVPREKYIQTGPNKLWRWVSRTAISYRSIRGFTFALVWADEITELQESCIREMNNRASYDESKLIYTGNPKGVTHPVKTGIADPIVAGDRPGHYFEFGIDDNPSLSDDIKRDLRAGTPPGPQYDRDILGKWANAGGHIYPSASDWLRQSPKSSSPVRCWVTVDAAEIGVYHALLIGEWPGRKHWVIGEYRHDGRAEGPQPKAFHAEKVCALGASAPAPVYEWLSDPADPVFIEALSVEHRRLGLPGVVLSAEQQPKPDEGVSVRAVNIAGNNGRLFIGPQAPQLMGELRALTYDEKKLAFGVEQPLAGDDHGADALRYWVWRSGIWKGASMLLA